jgi:hypothetical protein
LVIIVMLSHRGGAIISILLGLAAISAGLLFGAGWPPMAETLLSRGGKIMAFSAQNLDRRPRSLCAGPHHLSPSPGRGRGLSRLGRHLYLGLWSDLGAEPRCVNRPAPSGGAAEVAATMYFSLATLTTTGYGDIVAVDPFARSLANVESLIGVFYVAITVAHLVTHLWI